MNKYIPLTLFTLSLLALSACSDDTPDMTQNLRKIGAPIQGVWQVANFDGCKTDNKDLNITITEDQIKFSNETTGFSSILLENMKKLNSTKFIMLSGTLNLYETNGERILAYIDEGDKLTFKGFIVNDKLLKRKDILENYNADGNAKRNVAALDFNFCRVS